MNTELSEHSWGAEPELWSNRHLTPATSSLFQMFPSSSTQLSPSLSESIINVASSVINMHLWAPIFLIRGPGRLLFFSWC